MYLQSLNNTSRSLYNILCGRPNRKEFKNTMRLPTVPEYRSVCNNIIILYYGTRSRNQQGIITIRWRDVIIIYNIIIITSM